MKRSRAVIDHDDEDIAVQSQRKHQVLNYVKEVSCMFSDQQEKLVMFRNLIKDLNARRIHTDTAVAAVKQLLKGRDDLILGFNSFMPQGTQINLDDDDDEKIDGKLKEAIDFVNDVKMSFQSDERVYKSFLDVLNLYGKKGVSVSQVYDEVSVLFKDHPALLQRFTKFISDCELPIGDVTKVDEDDERKSVKGLGLNSGFVSYDEDEALKSVFEQGLAFCEKVKGLYGLDSYMELLKYIHNCSTGVVERKDLRSLVFGLIGHQQDLMSEFNQFLKSCKNINRSDDGVVSEKLQCGEKGLSISVKVKKKDIKQRDAREGAAKEKYMDKPIRKLDLSNCESCSPSYRLLPQDYPIISARNRSRVLNDCWVVVPSRDEDYSCKHKHRNQHEIFLFKCEDEQFELDLLIGRTSSAANSVEVLLNSINENTIDLDTQFCMEDHLNALNLRCIERLYDDHGLEVLYLLRENPTRALPKILTRLKQKQEECTLLRSDCNKVWAEVYAKNYHKSLDNHSSCPKQQDSEHEEDDSQKGEKEEKVQIELDVQREKIEQKMQKEDDVLLAAVCLKTVN